MAISEGFEPEVVVEAYRNVSDAYDRLQEAYYSKMQSSFIDAMADKWASPKAQEFFFKGSDGTTVKAVMEDLITRTQSTFETVFGAIDSAAKKWSLDTGALYSNAKAGALQLVSSKQLNFDVILADIQGKVGVDKESAVSTAQSGLTNVKTDIVSALQSAVDAVNRSGFIGGDQQESLIESLKTIADSVEKNFEELENGCVNAISATVDLHGQIASAVANAFSGGGQ